MKTDNLGRVGYNVRFYWTERHHGYKHEEADSDGTNTRGRPHLTANRLPVPDLPRVSLNQYSVMTDLIKSESHTSLLG